MEDAVNEVPSLNHNSEDDGSKGKALEEKVKDKDTNGGGGGGGVINNFISTFMTPLSPRIEKLTTPPQDGSENKVFEKEVDENGGGRKGVISNLVSNIFHRSEKNEEGMVEKEDEEIKVDEKVKRLKTENEANNGGGESGGGGGFIHDIVSHLPTSIPDDAGPTADEAAILINSLVRD
ncbi:uncharacterized protein LOC131611963 [Vicia villosa]|uniref:uncharacterized protein LOC131611963 n=1 Tax=Vicia villosa TaxID=3911 RepID=UPI00273BF844|nr:uncharacterized protein LOC131611963 [Vicia villosa]